MTIMYWLPRDNLIGKRPVKSTYPCYFGVKGVRNAPHLCVFVGSWSGNIFSRAYLFLIGYSLVDCNILFYWSICPFAVTIGS